MTDQPSSPERPEDGPRGLIHELKRFSSYTPGKIDLERSSFDELFNGEDASDVFDTVYL